MTGPEHSSNELTYHICSALAFRRGSQLKSGYCFHQHRASRLSFSTAPPNALHNPRHTVHQSPLATPTLQCIWKSTKPAWKKTRFSFTVYSQLAWKTS